MKVALLCDFFSSLGGTEYYNFILSKTFSEMGIEVKVFIGERPKFNFWIKKLDELNINYYFPNEFCTDLTDRTIEKHFISIVEDEIRDWNPDIIHANPPGKMLVSWYKRVHDRKWPVVVTEWTMPSENTAFWYPKELKSCINNADVMIATCESLIKGIRRFHGYRGRIEVISHLIKKPENIEHVDDECNLYSVGCIGRFSPEKGIEFLLGAWDRVVKDYPKATLHLYGHGSGEKHLRMMVKALGLQNSVFFEGLYEPITGIDKVVYKHQIYIQPSLFESIPTSIIELMGRGRVIIATDVGGVSELINARDKNGVLIPRASTDNIYNALATLFTNSELRKKIQEQVLKTFYQRYDVKEKIKKIIEIYEGLLNN